MAKSTIPQLWLIRMRMRTVYLAGSVLGFSFGCNLFKRETKSHHTEAKLKRKSNNKKRSHKSFNFFQTVVATNNYITYILTWRKDVFEKFLFINQFKDSFSQFRNKSLLLQHCVFILFLISYFPCGHGSPSLLSILHVCWKCFWVESSAVGM